MLLRTSHLVWEFGNGDPWFLPPNIIFPTAATDNYWTEQSEGETEASTTAESFESYKTQMDEYYERENRMNYIAKEIAKWAAFLSKLTEIGILAVFVTLVLTTVHLWEEMKHEAEALLLDKETSRDISVDLDRWWGQYDHVCLLIDQINRAYGFVLLVFLSYSFVYLIQQFPHVFALFYDKYTKERLESNSEVYMFHFFIFFHEALRFFVMIVIVHRCNVQVSSYAISKLVLLKVCTFSSKHIQYR